MIRLHYITGTLDGTRSYSLKYVRTCILLFLRVDISEELSDISIP